MKKPIHFDVDAEVGKVRAELERMVPLAKARAKTKKDLEYIACQQAYHPLILLSVRIELEAKNASANPTILATSLGATMGQIAAMSANSTRESMSVLGPFYDCFQSVMSGGTSNKAIVGNKIIATPTTGGNA